MRWTQTVNDDTATITIFGNIDESANPSLLDLASSIKSAQVIFDCKEINTVNSIGISSWATFIKGIQNQHQLYFTKCPQVFIEVCMMIPLATGGGTIQSLYLTYQCKPCAKSTSSLIAGKELAKYEQLAQKPCGRCGKPAAVVEDIEEYAAMLKV